MILERIGCTDEMLEELEVVYSDNPFLIFCVQLHKWAMKHSENLIYYDEPYILKSATIPVTREFPVRPKLSIKRPGKYALSVESEEAAKKLQAEAIAILKANNKAKGKKENKSPGNLKLNSKVLPTSYPVKLSIGPAYSVSHSSTERVLKVFEKRLSSISESIEAAETPEYKNSLKASYEELDNQINEWRKTFKKRNVKKLKLAIRCGNQYRFSYFNTTEGKRCQVGFGDVIVFYGSPKPALTTRQPSKKRTDTRDSDPNLLYCGEFEDFETYISI